MKQLEENIAEKLLDLDLSHFLEVTSKEKTTILHQIRKFYTAKEILDNAQSYKNKYNIQLIWG